MERVEDVDEDEKDCDQKGHSSGHDIRGNQKASLFVENENTCKKLACFVKHSKNI